MGSERDNHAGRPCVYHMVQPYFFAHHHLHRRKLESLRAAGLQAWCLAVVPEGLYREHRARYEAAVESGFAKVFRVPTEATVNRRVARFLAWQALRRGRVLVHVLRCDPTPVIRLRRWPGMASKIRFVLEYEGDQPAELVYEAAFVEDPRPPEAPPSELKQTYNSLLAQQLAHARESDGMVLMSREHIDVWENRLGRSIQACCLPTLPDPSRIRFEPEARTRIRSRLGLTDEVVFAYAGNVVCKWQRFESMCRFVGRLTEWLPSARLLALVRVDDLEMAREIATRCEVAERSTILHVPPEEVAGYLSAADAALFLRHTHTMNLVVTSAKLGEYLAAGLPVVTTGANASVVNEFIRSRRAGVFVPDSLTIDDRTQAHLAHLLRSSADPAWRGGLSEATSDWLGGENDPFPKYVTFIHGILS